MFTTLRSKIFAGFAAVIAVNLGLILWSVSRFAESGNEVVSDIATYQQTHRQILDLVELQNEQFRSVESDSITPDDAVPDRYRRAHRKFEQSLSSTARASANDSLLLSRIERIDHLHLQFDSLALLRFDGTTQDLSIPASIHDSLTRLLFSLADGTVVSSTNVAAEVSARVKSTLLFVTLGTLLAAVIALSGAAFYSRWAVSSIERLRTGVRNIRKGELSQKIHITSTDELGELSFEFNRMVDQLRMYESMNLENLLLEKRKAESIVHAITVPIVVFTSELEVVLLNTAALRLFRSDVELESEQISLPEVIGDPDLLALLAARTDASHVESEASQIWVTEKEGKEYFYLIQFIPLLSKQTGQGVIAVFTDVTEFKELDRLKSDLLARISHEFRTPLSSILMSSDILREGLLGALNERQSGIADQIKRDAQRLAKLINDILEMSRLESAQTEERMHSFDLVSLLQSVIDENAMIAQENGINLRLDSHERSLDIFATEEHFRWMANNLIGNGLKHTPAGGNIVVTLQPTEDQLVLSVTDTGEGIPKDSIDLIFERFYQVDRGSQNAPGSIGLGLAIVHDLVGRYGGTISVRSELGQGSEFTIRIPMRSLTNRTADE